MAEVAPETPPETPPGTPPETPPEPQPEAVPEPTPAPDDWRATLKSDDAKKFAESSPDVAHLVDRALKLQNVASTAILPLAKNASEDDVAAYRKRLGVPEGPDGYKFVMPEGQEATDADKQFQEVMGKAFHDINISAAQSEALNQVFNGYGEAVKKAQIAEDKKYADESDAKLRLDWLGKEYGANNEHSERAAVRMFGDDLEEVRHMETSSGRFVLDHPVMKRALAVIGREMAEGGLVPPLSEGDRAAADDRISDIRAKITEARGSGNDKLANRLYKEEQALITKTQGNAPIVGAEGRAT